MNDVMISVLPFAPAFDGAFVPTNETSASDSGASAETNFILSTDEGTAQLNRKLCADLQRSDAFSTLFLPDRNRSPRSAQLRIDTEGNEIAESADLPRRNKETDYRDPTTDAQREGLQAIITEALLIGAGIKLFEHFKARREFGDEPTGLLMRLATSNATAPAVEAYRLLLEMQDWDTAKRALVHAWSRKDRTLLDALVAETNRDKVASLVLAEYARRTVK